MAESPTAGPRSFTTRVEEAIAVVTAAPGKLSAEALVRMVHPYWDEEQVAAEVRLIAVCAPLLFEPGGTAAPCAHRHPDDADLPCVLCVVDGYTPRMTR